MTPEQLLELINKDESEHLEFKAAMLNRDEIAEYAVAIGNEGGGSLVFGVTNKKPREPKGVAPLTLQDMQQTKRSVFDSTGIRIEIETIVINGVNVLCIEIPSRLRGQVLHTKKGKYLMRSGEDLVGMTPGQIAAILQEAAPQSTPESQTAKDLADLVAKNLNVRVTPIIPAYGVFDFRVVAADKRIVCLMRVASSQEVVIPASRITEVMWQGGSTPPLLKVNGRLQWVTVRQEWQFFDEAPSNDEQRQFGFFKAVGHQTPRVLEVCRFLQGLGYDLRWFNQNQIVNQLGSNWEIVYGTDGCFFKIVDSRISQILAKTVQSRNSG
jgi:hypothetical protein